MKHQWKVLVSILAVGVIAFASCKKKTDDATRSKIIGKWRLLKRGDDINNNGTLDANEVIVIPDSIVDLFTFNGDGSCDITANGMQVSKFMWSLVNNNADIKIQEASDEIIEHIESLSVSDMQLKNIATYGSSTKTSWTFLHKQ